MNAKETEQPKGFGIGIVVFVVLCGMPALELTGFGFEIPITLPIALVCSVIGGSIGGLLMCPKPWQAGLIGGLVAGPLGLLAVYFYSDLRDELWNFELAIVQGIASLPGVGVGKLIISQLENSESHPSDNWTED